MSRAAGAVPSLRAAARGSAAGPTMIKAILIFNNHGKPRLSKFYQRYVWVGRAAPRRAGRGGAGRSRGGSRPEALGVRSPALCEEGRFPGRGAAGLEGCCPAGGFLEERQLSGRSLPFFRPALW